MIRSGDQATCGHVSVGEFSMTAYSALGPHISHIATYIVVWRARVSAYHIGIPESPLGILGLAPRPSPCRELSGTYKWAEYGSGGLKLPSHLAALARIWGALFPGPRLDSGPWGAYSGRPICMRATSTLAFIPLLLLYNETN